MSDYKRQKIVTAIAAIGGMTIAASLDVLTSRNLSASTLMKSPTKIVASRNLPASFSDILDRVGPAVVSIRVTVGTPAKSAAAPEIPEPFKRFFGDNFGFHFGNPQETKPRRAPMVQGMGSGFFIDADGHVVTNNHVTRGAEKVEVMLKSGETFEAKLVGSDPKTDLALLKVESQKKFPFIRFGKSSKARVGDWVIALGSPFGLGQTATIGIVSASGRDIGAGPYDDFLQIDAPINKGNSGGPTFNVHGEVIGVNTAIISPTGVSAGIGFAVPSDMAKLVVEQLREKGTVSRGWLGVNIQQLTKDLAAGLGMINPEGALIASVTMGGPAHKAGLKAGDVIVSLDGERIEKMRDLPKRVAGLQAGQSTRFRVVRDGSERSIDVVIGEMPRTIEVSATASNQATQPKFGMRLAAINNQTRARFRIGKAVEGVVVIAVDKDSVAAEKGIRPGDVVRRISGLKILDPAQLSRLVAKAIEQAKEMKRKTILVLVNRRGRDRYVALSLRDA
ncbi:MAG: Do family serine endopeptidase [Pseudomonadota bacterium]|nr:Do family serine endopeptidase [Pseudomonadota bacterium]